MCVSIGNQVIRCGDGKNRIFSILEAIGCDWFKKAGKRNSEDIFSWNTGSSFVSCIDWYVFYVQKDCSQGGKTLCHWISHTTTEDDKSTGFDPFTKSLNCVRGVAMHGIIHYSLYLVRQKTKLENKKSPKGFLETEVIKILDDRLDKTKERSLAVHSVYGAYIPQIHFLDRDWLGRHLKDIFPVDDNNFHYS